MTLNFKPFAAAVAAQYAMMAQHELYTTQIDGDAVYAAYLKAFPPGTNPIYRTNTEHECSCCRNFIKNLGSLVAIIGGEVVTVWDNVPSDINVDLAYKEVAGALSQLIRSTPIDTIFRTSEPSYGAETTKEMMSPDHVHIWNHFHGKVAAKHLAADPGVQRGIFTSARDVFKRGVTELTTSALDTVMQLIDDKQIYRGDEHRASVLAFRTLHNVYNSIKSPETKDLYLAANALHSASRFRNTVIGSLVVALSAGEDEEQSIKAFEKKVAPENYKRPTAMVTEGMKKTALATITQLGLENALLRRLARPSDVTINNVLWADNGVKPMMKDGIAGIMDSIGTANNLPMQAEKAQDVSISEFLANILPKAKTIDLLVKNRHLTNLMAITAPALPGQAGVPLFKWDNAFAWTYTGNIADSIKERVKAAGGATDAVVRVSLAWHNGDDLDLHAHEPNGEHIYFGTRGRKTLHNKGMLDVDMNAGYATNSKDPVENITWDTPADGIYRIDVNNYSLRSKSNVGYTLEVENNGIIHQFTSEQSPTSGATHKALVLTIKDRKIIDAKLASNLTGGSFSQSKWGIATEQPVRVNMVMLSPNYWDGNAVGNKHYMFILDGCKTDEPLRGILNEYLNSKLEVHRKVFEVLGDKTKCVPVPTEEQLAGLGFSSTKGDSVTVQVTGDKLRKIYNIIF